MSIMRKGNISNKDYYTIDKIVKEHMGDHASKEDLDFYSKFHMLTIVFKLFWDKQPLVDHVYFLNILLYQRLSEIVDKDVNKQAQILVDIMEKYVVEGVNEKNIYQVSYLIQNFFLNRQINDELMLTYFVLYAILITRYQIDSKKKVDVGVELPSSIYLTDEDKVKIIDKIKLFNLDRVDVSKETELDAIINMTRPIYRYFLSVYAKMLSVVGI